MEDANNTCDKKIITALLLTKNVYSIRVLCTRTELKFIRKIDKWTVENEV